MLAMRGSWLGPWVLSGVITVMTSCGPAREAEYPPSPSVARALNTAEKPVRVLDLELRYQFDEKGNWTETVRHRYQIKNRRGVEHWASVEAGWSPWYMERPRLSAQVLDPDGTIRKLEPATIAESARYPDVPDVYSDGRLLRAPLPGVRVGSIVEETIVQKTTRPFFAGGSSFDVTLQGSVPRNKVQVVIDLPPDSPFQFELLDAKVAVHDETKNGKRRVTFSGGPYEGIEPLDELAPPELSRWPSVAFSTAKSWQQLAKAYSATLDAKIDEPGVDELVARTIATGEPRATKIAKLLAETRRRVRYAAVQFGQAAIIPDEPRDTLKRAYGDCKDQAALLVALLREAGIDANVALLRTGPGEDVRPRVPALDVFDHMIVVLPGEQPMWIDPTASYSRAGELPEGDQGRLALIIDEDTTELTRTPISAAAANTYSEVREVRLQPYGPAVIKEVSTASGVPEARMRGSFSDPNQEDRKALSEYVKETYYAPSLERSTFADADDLTTLYRLEITAKGAKVASTELLGAGLDTSYGAVFGYLPGLFWAEEEQTRKVDLLLPFAYRAEVVYRVSPPADFVLVKAPHFKPLALGPARFTRSIETKPDGVVELRFALHVDQQRLSPAEVTAMRKALKALDEEQSTYLEFEPVGEVQIQARQTGKGLQTFLALVEKAPRDPLARQRFALSLADAGFGDAARREARAAVELSPDSAVAHRTLGIVLSKDAFGRDLARGYDRQGALAALRRAAQLNEEDVYSKVQVGVLLDHDEEGRHYGDREGAAQAAGHYDSIPAKQLEAYEEGAFKDNALYSLLWSGQFHEVFERLKDRASPATPAELAIMATTMEIGAAAGIGETERLGLRGEERSKALARAGETLYSMSHYAQAATLMKAASQDSSESASYANRGRLMQAVKPVDVAQLKADTPENTAKLVLALVTASAKPDEAALQKLSSARAPRHNSSRVELLSLSYGIGSAGEPRLVLKDALLAWVQAKSEGNDQTGYRVRFNSELPGLSVPNKVALFIVKEGGSYRVRASGTEKRELGCEALQLLTEKKQRAARQWLEWAAESSSTWSGGEDPLRQQPFLRVWRDGKGDLELAAATLCAGGSQARAAIEVLRTARKKHDADHAALDQAIADAAGGTGKTVEALEAARRLREAYPRSGTARELELRALAILGRDDEYTQVLRRALQSEKQPGSERAELLTQLARARANDGDLKGSRQSLLQIIKEGQASESVYAKLAWNGLLVGAKAEEVLEHALKGVRDSGYVAPDDLRTLASAYLFAGKIEEARQTLNRLLEKRLGGQPDVEDWYVIGGIAEAYGLKDVARAAYGKLQPPTGKSPTSAYHLAQRRLSALDATPKRAN
jgi:transglutaminase-like putative cysteine protease